MPSTGRLADTKYEYPAVIDRVGAEISSNRGGVEVYAALGTITDNPSIRPGAFVELEVPDILFPNSVTIPESAIYNNNRVYVKSGESLQARTVKILAFNNGSAIISGDLKENERVLTTRIAEISDGLLVRENANGG